MKKGNSSKKLFLIVTGGILVAILAFFAIKFATKKENSLPDEQKRLKPLNKLNDQELEKCLLEDFSRRLDLEKYFVFNLGEEVKLERGFLNNVSRSNVRLVNDKLCSDLTGMTENLLKRGKIKKKINTTDYQILNKIAITFTGENLNLISTEWDDKNLDEKIKEGKDCFIFINIEEIEDEKNYFTKTTKKGELCWNGHVIVSIKNPKNIVCKSKQEALEIIKTDPALAGKP